MHINKLKYVLQSFVVFPMFAMTMPLASLDAVGSVAADIKTLTSEVSVITTQEEVERSEKAEAIDAYFKILNHSGFFQKRLPQPSRNQLSSGTDASH